MFKKAKLLVLFISGIFFLSCSSNDDGIELNSIGNFNFSKDGQVIKANEWSAYQSYGEDKYNIFAYLSDGSQFSIVFDKFGHFGDITLLSTMGTSAIKKTNFYNLSSDYFNFELVSFDENSKTFKVNFSGKLYTDENDLNSDFSEVSGSISGKVTHTVTGTNKMKAKINGAEWHAMKQRRNNTHFPWGEENHDVVLQMNSDDEFKITAYFNNETIEEGTYDFDNSTSDHIKFILSRYDISTGQYTNYNCNGTIDIVSRYLPYFSGNFNLTAVNPIDGSQIIVTEGNFELSN